MPKYINADVLKQQMLKYGWRHPDSTVYEFVDDMPAADVVEVKHGKWAEAHDTSGHNYQRCTECGIYIQDIFFANDYDANFCPNCGADMRGEIE
jgi:predicted RNA-binding Zn-ribbon protein involved in translation (DUF1610 family)